MLFKNVHEMLYDTHSGFNNVTKNAKKYTKDCKVNIRREENAILYAMLFCWISCRSTYYIYAAIGINNLVEEKELKK